MRRALPLVLLTLVAACGVLVWAKWQRGDLLKARAFDVVAEMDCSELDRRYLQGLVERYHPSVNVAPHTGVVPAEAQDAYLADLFSFVLIDMRKDADIALIRKVEAARDGFLGKPPTPPSAPPLENVETAFACTACGHGFRMNILELQSAITGSLVAAEANRDVPRLVNCFRCGELAARPGSSCARCNSPFLPKGRGAERTHCTSCRPTLWICLSKSCSKVFELSADKLASTPVSETACPGCGSSQVGLAAKCSSCQGACLREDEAGPTKKCPHCGAPFEVEAASISNATKAEPQP